MSRRRKYQTAVALDAAERVLPGWVLGPLIGHHLRAQYRPAGVIFVHIPRTGGTSVTRTLYARGVGHRTAAEIQRYAGTAMWNQYPSFAIVRDPVARLKSAYRYVAQGGTADGIRVPRRAYRSGSWSTFERFVVEWLSQADLRKADRLFWPQRWFVEGDSSLASVVVWRYSNFDGLVSWLSEHTGRSVSMPWLNALSPPAVEIEMTRTITSTIERVYEADYELYERAI